MISERENPGSGQGPDPAEAPHTEPSGDLRVTALRLQGFLRSLPQEMGSDLLGDAAFMMLLDLLIAEFEKRRLPIKSVCIGSGVPQSTALRYIDRLEADGLVKRHANPCDRRSAHIALTPQTSTKLRSILSTLASNIRYS